jgi:hypothetical protein
MAHTPDAGNRQEYVPTTAYLSVLTTALFVRWKPGV